MKEDDHILAGLPSADAWRRKKGMERRARREERRKRRKLLEKNRYARERDRWLAQNPDKTPSDFSSEYVWGSSRRKFDHIRSQRVREYQIMLRVYAYVRWGILPAGGRGNAKADTQQEYNELLDMISSGYNPDTGQKEDPSEMYEIQTPHKRGVNTQWCPLKGRWDITYQEWLDVGGRVTYNNPKLLLTRKDPNGPFSSENMVIKPSK